MNPLRDRCACGCSTWRVTASPTAPIVLCDACGRLVDGTELSARAPGDPSPNPGSDASQRYRDDALPAAARDASVEYSGDPSPRAALRRLTGPLALIVHQLEGQADAGIVDDLGAICDRLVELAGELEEHASLPQRDTVARCDEHGLDVAVADQPSDSAAVARAAIASVLEAFDDATVAGIRNALEMAHLALADADLRHRREADHAA